MEKYRVAQCYTGAVGAEIVRRLAGHPLLELVGVLVHYPQKAGKDSGELVGGVPNGVITTTSLEEIIALKPDAAIWCGATYDIDAYARILEAGINLYTGMGAWFLEGQPEQARLRDAALKGSASLCAGGNIPGLISDVLPLFLTGYTGRIRQLRMWQRNDMASGPSAVQIQVLGVGLPPGEGAHAEAINLGWTHSMEQSSRMIAHALGVEWQGVSLEAVEYALAPEDYLLASERPRNQEGHGRRGSLDLLGTCWRTRILPAGDRAIDAARSRTRLAHEPRRAGMAGRDRRRSANRVHLRLAGGHRAGQGVPRSQRGARDQHRAAADRGEARRADRCSIFHRPWRATDCCSAD